MAPDIDGKLYLTEFPDDAAPQAGRLARVRITRATEYDLVGRVEEFLDSPRAAAPAPLVAGGVLRVVG